MSLLDTYWSEEPPEKMSLIVTFLGKAKKHLLTKDSTPCPNRDRREFTDSSYGVIAARKTDDRIRLARNKIFRIMAEKHEQRRLPNSASHDARLSEHTYIHAESAVSGKMHVNARGSAVSELPGGRCRGRCAAIARAVEICDARVNAGLAVPGFWRWRH